jgi:hypothetical protein
LLGFLKRIYDDLRWRRRKGAQKFYYREFKGQKAGYNSGSDAFRFPDQCRALQSYDREVEKGANQLDEGRTVPYLTPPSAVESEHRHM